MPVFPLEVELDEKALIRLAAIYRRAQREIVATLEGASNFNVANRRAILAQIDAILTELGNDTGELINEQIPKFYKKGATDAVKQLKRIDAEVAVSTGFNRVHEAAIKALVDDTARAFGESITGVSRNAQLLLNKAVREEMTYKLAEGKITGSALRKIKQMIVGVMREQGLAALVDKGGRKWTLDRYAEMLIRTKSVEARNRGLMNRMVENDYDLVQVSDHGASSCPLCGPWQGKVVSSTGKTKGYPTLAEAEAEGLFHPNCRHAINVVVPTLAKRTKAYDFRTKRRK